MSFKIIIKTDKVPAFIQGMVDRKRLVESYCKGEITKAELNAKGVRLATPV